MNEEQYRVKIANLERSIQITEKLLAAEPTDLEANLLRSLASEWADTCIAFARFKHGNTDIH